MIYIIYSRQLDAIKVGYSKHPEKRLSDLQVSNSTDLEIIHIEKGDIPKEKFIHSKLLKHKIRGEWFKFNKECRNELSVYLDEYIDIDMKGFLLSKTFLLTLEKWNLTISHLQMVGFLINNFKEGEVFTIDKELKEKLAIKNHKSPTTYNNVTRKLLDEGIIIKKGTKKYKLNNKFIKDCL